MFALKPSEESQEFTDLVTFVAQVASSYPQHMQGFVQDLSGLLDTHYAVLNSSVRHALVKALILLRNRKQVSFWAPSCCSTSKHVTLVWRETVDLYRCRPWTCCRYFSGYFDARTKACGSSCSGTSLQVTPLPSYP